MKAISLKQPWANLVADGRKTIETRTWPTRYRGKLVICSSKTPNIYPAGFAIATADIYDCKPMEKIDEVNACVKIYPKAHSWFLKNIRKIKPIPVKGSLGIYNLDIKI